MSQKYDADEDNRVTAAEYSRGGIRFANYDRNGDGDLTEADFPTDTFINGFNHMIIMEADADGNEEVSRSEWSAFGASLDGDGDGEMTVTEVSAVVGGWAMDWPLFLLSFDQDSDGDFDSDDLEITFTDQDFDGNGVLAGRETEGWKSVVTRPEGSAPAAGDDAPDFDLPYALDISRSFHLRTAVVERPVALVFGSYT